MPKTIVLRINIILHSYVIYAIFRFVFFSNIAGEEVFLYSYPSIKYAICNEKIDATQHQNEQHRKFQYKKYNKFK